MGSEYGDSGDRSIQGIFDKRSVVLYSSTLSKMKRYMGKVDNIEKFCQAKIPSACSNQTSIYLITFVNDCVSI